MHCACLNSLCAGQIPCDLNVGQHDTKADHDPVGIGGLLHEVRATPPIPHDDENDEQSEQLPDLDPDVERQQIGEKPIFGNLIFEDLRGKAGAVEQAEDKRRPFGVGLKA